MKLAKQEKRETQPWTSPLGHLSRLHDEIDRLFEEPFGGWMSSTPPSLEAWFPSVDVYQDKDNVLVKAELPGMKKEDIEVSVSGEMLSITGHRESESECKGAECFRSERMFGRFQRTIGLPVSVQGERIHAEYKDGVLTITCPKTEEAKQKHIEIKVE